MNNLDTLKYDIDKIVTYFAGEPNIKDTIARVELMVRAMIDYEEYQRYLDFGLRILRQEMGTEKNGEWDHQKAYPVGPGAYFR